MPSTQPYVDQWQQDMQELVVAVAQAKADLWIAVDTGDLERVKALVKGGIEPDLEGVDAEGQPASPFSLACKRGHMRVVAFLAEELAARGAK